MSRARDLRQPPLPPSSNPSSLQSALPPTTASHQPSSSIPPPMRPQRSAARLPHRPATPSEHHHTQPFFSSPPHDPPRLQSSPNPSPWPSDRAPTTLAHHHLRSSPQKWSRQSPNLNPSPLPPCRPSDELQPSAMLSPHRNLDHTRSTSSSSTGSFDPESNNDLLSENDLKAAKQLHNSRNVIQAFQESAAHSRAPQRKQTAQYPISRRPTQDSNTSLSPQQPYPSTPGFREIERVLQNITLTWHSTGITQTGDPHHDGYDPDHPPPPFSAVRVALDLLKGESEDSTQAARKANTMVNQNAGSIPSLSSFLQVKAQLEKALQLTIQGHYRQFDASVNAYKLTKANVENSHRKVMELRSKLIQCRTTFSSANAPSSLGTGPGSATGNELKALQARRELLGQVLKLIDIIDQLRQVPDWLESLVAAKRFLPAAVLLVRSLRTISKPEFFEISGLAGLRAYLVDQETALYEILLEELHNHLYLKSYLCDNKWKPYRRGQTDLPVIDLIGDHTDDSPDPFTQAAPHLNRSTPSLQQYLDDLLTKPHSNPLLDEPEIQFATTSSPADDHTESAALRLSSMHANVNGKKRRNQTMNVESNSFSYIESLIESLGVLGKLGLGLDVVLQKVPLEIHALVDRTLSEVDDRHERAKRSFSFSTSSKQSAKNNLSIMSLLIRNESVSSLPKLHQSSAIHSPMKIHHFTGPPKELELSLNQLDEVDSTMDVLRDLFWTLYSKLDATLQSFRVLYEVSLRIIDRKDFKEDGIKSGQALFSLFEVWKPIQSEVRALMHDYLTDLGIGHFVSSEGIFGKDSVNPTSTGTRLGRRNPMASIAEVLKINLSGSSTVTSWKKDSSRPMFKFKDAGPKANIQELKAHESHLDSALRASVPGLVLSSNAARGGLSLALGVKSDDSPAIQPGGGAWGDVTAGGSDSASVGTHRLLVKPDAFYIGILLQPTLRFLNRAREVLPSGVVLGSNEDAETSIVIDTQERTPPPEDSVHGQWSSTNWKKHRVSAGQLQFGGFAGFLEDFVLNTFLPQLEEKVLGILDYVLNTSDAFQQNMSERVPSHSRPFLKRQAVWRKPIAKSLSGLLRLIESLCDMTQSTPFHQEKYGRLVVSLIFQYHQKCHERYKGLVARESSEVNLRTTNDGDLHYTCKLAANWAQTSALLPCLQALDDKNLDEVRRKKLLANEVKIERRLLETRQVTTSDLILAQRKLSSLAQLCWTLECFLSFINSLACVVVPVSDPEGEGEEGGDFEEEIGPHDATERFSFPSQANVPFPATSFRMPLTYGNCKRFHMARRSFQSLAQTVVCTLRLEFRIQSWYYMEQSFRDGNYYLSPSDSIEPEDSMINLSSSISSLDSSIGTYLSRDQLNYVLFGLSGLLNEMLVDKVVELKLANEVGFQKMVRNVLAVHQSMKTLYSTRRHGPGMTLRPRSEPCADEDGEVDDRMDRFRRRIDQDFEPSRKFWEAASQGPKAVMTLVRSGVNFSFEQYRHVLCLLCMIDPQTKDSIVDLAKQSMESLGKSEWSSSSATLTNTTASPLRGPQLSSSSAHCWPIKTFDQRRRTFNECLIELQTLCVLENSGEDDEEWREDDV